MVNQSYRLINQSYIKQAYQLPKYQCLWFLLLSIK